MKFPQGLKLCGTLEGIMKGQMIGYARVSSTGQNLDVQLQKLKDCDKIFEEKVSGTNRKRAKLEECLNYIREGDTLIVTRLDRLARSTLHLCQIAKDLESRGVNLKVLDQNIDTSNATGRLLFNMLGAIGQFETEIRAERQSEGIKNAIDSGVKFGREYKLTAEQLKELRDRRKNKALIKTLMADYGLSKTSVYRYLSEKD